MKVPTQSCRVLVLYHVIVFLYASSVTIMYESVLFASTFLVRLSLGDALRCLNSSVREAREGEDSIA